MIDAKPISMLATGEPILECHETYGDPEFGSDLVIEAKPMSILAQ